MLRVDNASHAKDFLTILSKSRKANFDWISYWYFRKTPLAEVGWHPAPTLGKHGLKIAQIWAIYPIFYTIKKDWNRRNTLTTEHWEPYSLSSLYSLLAGISAVCWFFIAYLFWQLEVHLWLSGGYQVMAVCGIGNDHASLAICTGESTAP